MTSLNIIPPLVRQLTQNKIEYGIQQIKNISINEKLLLSTFFNGNFVHQHWIQKLDNSFNILYEKISLQDYQNQQTKLLNSQIDQIFK